MIRHGFGQEIVAIDDVGSQGSSSFCCCEDFQCVDDDQSRCVAVPFVLVDDMRKLAHFHGF